MITKLKQIQARLTLSAAADGKEVWKAKVLKVYPDAIFKVTQDSSRDVSAYLDVGSKKLTPGLRAVLSKYEYLLKVASFNGYIRLGTITKKSDTAVAFKKKAKFIDDLAAKAKARKAAK